MSKPNVSVVVTDGNGSLGAVFSGNGVAKATFTIRESGVVHERTYVLPKREEGMSDDELAVLRDVFVLNRWKELVVNYLPGLIWMPDGPDIDQCEVCGQPIPLRPDFQVDDVESVGITDAGRAFAESLADERHKPERTERDLQDGERAFAHLWENGGREAAERRYEDAKRIIAPEPAEAQFFVNARFVTDDGIIVDVPRGKLVVNETEDYGDGDGVQPFLDRSFGREVEVKMTLTPVPDAAGLLYGIKAPVAEVNLHTSVTVGQRTGRTQALLGKAARR